jgi:hypothetical protein
MCNVGLDATIGIATTRMQIVDPDVAVATTRTRLSIARVACSTTRSFQGCGPFNDANADDADLTDHADTAQEGRHYLHPDISVSLP